MLERVDNEEEGRRGENRCAGEGGQWGGGEEGGQMLVVEMRE